MTKPFFATNLGPTSKSVINISISNKILELPNKSQGSSSTDVTIADQRLKSTIEWNMVKKVCQSGYFDDVPDEINMDYALSFIA